MSFFDSEIVQEEAKQLFQDCQNLMKLGERYGQFDREGKKIFIERMEELLERQRIFMKRLELSEDFMAQMAIKQLQTQLGGFGLSLNQMFDQTYQTLERMKAEAEAER